MSAYPPDAYPLPCRKAATQTPSGFRQWLTGMNLYMDGEPLAACANDRQRRGYAAAAEAEAQFSVPTMPRINAAGRGR